jgi:hypothetical protein
LQISHLFMTALNSLKVGDLFQRGNNNGLIFLAAII